MNPIQKIINLFKGEKELEYPPEFYIVDWSSVALENGIKDDHNKVITRYYYDRYGFLKTKKYTYSEARIHALKTIHRLPGFDKTHKEQKFPIYARISPGEVKYTTQ